MTSTPEIEVDRLEAVHGGGTVIDVREPAEYATGHVPGVRLVPMGQLVARGIDAYSVAGGTAAWARSGRPIESGAPHA